MKFDTVMVLCKTSVIKNFQNSNIQLTSIIIKTNKKHFSVLFLHVILYLFILNVSHLRNDYESLYSEKLIFPQRFNQSCVSLTSLYNFSYCNFLQAAFSPSMLHLLRIPTQAIKAPQLDPDGASPQIYEKTWTRDTYYNEKLFHKGSLTRSSHIWPLEAAIVTSLLQLLHIPTLVINSTLTTRSLRIVNSSWSLRIVNSSRCGHQVYISYYLLAKPGSWVALNLRLST